MRLQIREQVAQQRQRVILAVTHQECQVDQVMRVCQVPQMAEEERQVGCSVTERGTEEDTFLALPAAGSAADIGKVVVANGLDLPLFALWEEGEGQAGGKEGGRAEGWEDEAQDEEEKRESAADSKK